jgi:LPS-assembly lipoprotein
MSSLNLKGQTVRSLAHVAVVAGLALGLSACFRPLHGPTATGQSLQTILASIDVPEINWSGNQARIGHYLRSELVYELNGSGSDIPKRYVLKFGLAQSLSTPIVDSESGRALSATITGNLTYTLTTPDGKTIITQGTATASTSYDRFEQRFAALRANRDAEIRLAKELAQQVKTRLQAHLVHI